MASPKDILPRLRSQFERGEPVLFTGAGFSLGARSSTGDQMPTSRVLTEEFWQLAFPSTPLDPSTQLGDAFYAVSQRRRSHLSKFVQMRLSVEGESLPSFYRRWFSMPWSRCYTLNVDDLELALMRRYQLVKSLRSVSATSGRKEGVNQSAPDELLVVHLNGLVGDDLSQLTFSPVDYGSRQSIPDEWMVKALNDILSRPVVFVGTDLDESTLWQYLSYRQNKGGRGTRELRPGSILVSPHINSAREMLLREFNIDWVGMDAEEFANEVLAELGSVVDQGHAALRSKKELDKRTKYPPLVSDLLVRSGSARTDYLMGQEPQWIDLSSGKAIARSCDPDIRTVADDILSGDVQGRPFLLTGTAGTGKSTSLMRMAMEISAKGIATYWVDEQSNFDPNRLRELITANQNPVAILVDDADLFGRLLSGWARELPQLRPKVLFGCAIRSSRVDGLMDKDTLGGIQPIEIGMPLLATRI